PRFHGRKPDRAACARGRPRRADPCGRGAARGLTTMGIAILVLTAAALPLQPLAQQARAVASTLAYLGQPLAPQDLRRIDDAIGEADETAASQHLQDVLDASVLAIVTVNPESRVKVAPGPARADLVEAGTRLFLVKV